MGVQGPDGTTTFGLTFSSPGATVKTANYALVVCIDDAARKCDNSISADVVNILSLPTVTQSGSLAVTPRACVVLNGEASC